jgi:hypothetical protein
MMEDSSADPTPRGSAHEDLLQGTWERKGRSPASAAVLGLLGIGVLYFNLQTILAMFAGGIVLAGEPKESIPPGFLERTLYLIELQATPFQVAILVSQFLFMLLPTWLVVRRWHTREVRRYIRLQPAPFSEVALAAGTTLLLMPSANYIANEFTRQLRVPDVLLQINSAIFTADAPLEFAWIVVVVALTPALCEEIFFRGFIQRTLERSIGWRSVVVMGVVFGLFHMQPIGLVTLSILGLLFGYFYFRSRSLLPGMTAHFSNNFLAVLLLYLQPSVGDVNVATARQFPLLWIAVTLPVGLALLVLYHRHTESRHTE